MHGRLIRIVLSAEGQRFADSTLYCGDTFIARSDVKTESRDSVRPTFFEVMPLTDLPELPDIAGQCRTALATDSRN